jgi:hypothetical protein
VAGLIEDLPPCAELIARIMTEAEERLSSMAALTGQPQPTAASPVSDQDSS